jgi:hypothetical protein
MMFLSSIFLRHKGRMNHTLIKIVLVSFLAGVPRFSKLDSERIIDAWDTVINVSNNIRELERDPSIYLQMKVSPQIFKTTPFAQFLEHGLIEIQTYIFDYSTYYYQINQEKQIFNGFSSQPAIEKKDYREREVIALNIQNKSFDRFLLSYSKNPRVTLVLTRS